MLPIHALALIAGILSVSDTSVALDTSEIKSQQHIHHYPSEIEGFLTISDSVVVPIEVRSVPRESFLSRFGPLLAALVGSLAAGLIAVYSVRRTHQNAQSDAISRRDRENQREAAVYFGLLYAIEVELQAHRIELRYIAQSLPEVRELSIVANNFIVASIPHEIPLEFTNVCRSKIIEYDRFTTKLLNQISTYVNSSASLNASLDFTVLIQVRQRVNTTAAQAQDAIVKVFDGLLDHLSRIVDGRLKLRAEIIKEIRGDPTNVIPEDEREDVEEFDLWEGKTLRI